MTPILNAVPEEFAGVMLKIQDKLGVELCGFLFFHMDEKGEHLVIEPKVDLAPKDVKKIAESTAQFNSEYVNGPKPYFQIPKPNPQKTLPESASEKTEKKEPVYELNPIGEFQKGCEKCIHFEKHCNTGAKAGREMIRLCVEVQRLAEIKKISGYLQVIAKDAEMKIEYKKTHDNGTTQTPATPAATKKKLQPQDIRMMLPEDLDSLLTFVEKDGYIIVRPRHFLGSENFAKIASVIRGAGGEYVSAGQDSHFKIPTGTSTPVQRSTRPTQGHEEGGIVWINTRNQKDEPYEKALEKDNQKSDAYFNLKAEIQEAVDAGKCGKVISGKWHWISRDGEWIGRKKTNPRRRRQ